MCYLPSLALSIGFLKMSQTLYERYLCNFKAPSDQSAICNQYNDRLYTSHETYTCTDAITVAKLIALRNSLAN